VVDRIRVSDKYSVSAIPPKLNTHLYCICLAFKSFRFGILFVLLPIINFRLSGIRHEKAVDLSCIETTINCKKQLSFDIKYDLVDIPRLVALLSILLYNI
jgi:hypothetical protein